MITRYHSVSSSILKGFFTLILIYSWNSLSAAIVTSVSAGNWSNGTTWNSGVQPLPTDCVIVNHAITMNVNITASSPGSITINASGSVIGNKNISIGAGANITNNGIIDCKMISNSGTIVNNDTINTFNQFNNSGGTLINNGTINANPNFNNNGGTIIGLGGSIIVPNNVINNAGGSISGQDICQTDGVTNPLTGGNIDSSTVTICGVPFSGPGPLPIKLVHFSAVQNGNVVYVSWTTVSEINNDYFTLEKSTNGIDFNEVIVVQGANNSNETLYYRAVDNNPYIGISYYRLKQTDYDGKSEYSDLVAINYSPEFSLNIYPNPVTYDNFNIIINGNKDEEAIIIVKDLFGKEHYSKAVIMNNSEYTLSIDSSKRFPPGIYIVVVSTQNNLTNKIIVLQ